MMDDMSMSPTSVGQIPELLQMALRTIRDTNSDYGDFFEHAHSIETNPPPFPYNVDYSEDESDCDYVSLPGRFLLIWDVGVFNGFSHSRQRAKFKYSSYRPNYLHYFSVHCRRRTTRYNQV